MADTISCPAFKKSISKYLVLDVREADEFSAGHINNAVNIPLGKLIRDEKLGVVPKNKDIVVHCQSGFRGEIAQKFLKEKDYKVKNLEGGYKSFKEL